MKTSIFTILASLILSAPNAQAGVLDFSGNICGDGTQACSNYSSINQSYGDVAGQLNVIYDGDISTPASTSLQYWDNYTGQLGVAWGSNNATSEIFLSPLSGYQVTLTSLTFGAFNNIARNSQLSLLDGNDSILSNSDSFSVLNPVTFSVNVTSANGIKIRWGTDFNVAIDNINFTITPVPEVNTYAMMLVGLGFMVTMARRRKTS